MLPKPLRPAAITLDLDDTLWPIGPTIRAAEAVANAWFAEHAPAVLVQWPEAERMRLRQQLVAAHPAQKHDLAFLRRMMFRAMLDAAGHDPARADEAFDLFIAERQRVSLYPGAREALQRLAARYPIAAVSNGNADLQTIGLSAHFRFSLSASDYGAAKPDPGIFLAACDRLGHAPDTVLHIGDDPVTDVLGARRAGLLAGWIQHDVAAWPHAEAHPAHQPDISAKGFVDLVDALLGD